jgi:prefoldin beta subunit
MASDAEIQKNVLEFEQQRSQLMSLGAQRQQLQLQVTAYKQALEELGKSKEKRVLKNVGPVLIGASMEDVKKELSEKIESLELRAKTVGSQEQTVSGKMSKLKHAVESEMKIRNAPPAEK